MTERIFKHEVELIGEPPEGAILLCNRVVDLPIPYQTGRIAICTAGCLERVWVADSSPQNLKVVCLQCGLDMLEKEPGPHQIAVTSEQRGAIARWRAKRGR